MYSTLGCTGECAICLIEAEDIEVIALGANKPCVDRKTQTVKAKRTLRIVEQISSLQKKAELSLIQATELNLFKQYFNQILTIMKHDKPSKMP